MMLRWFGLFLLVSSCTTTLSGTIVSTKKDVSTFKDGKVNIMALDGSTPSQVVDIGPNGEFSSVESLNEGIYLIEALVPGFKPVSEKFKISDSRVVTLKVEPLDTRPQVFGVNSTLELGRGEGGAKITPPQL